MFNSEFFPTDDNTISKMIELSGIAKILKKSRITILEPSAGKGNILDYLKDRYYLYNTSANLICFECHPELQSILRDKKYNLIGSDFLTEPCVYSPDLIIMNPPFSNADKHFLRAWEILQNGTILCLVNSETINNPYSKDRQKVVSIIEESSGSIFDLGECFSDSERKTKVNVSLIVVSKQTERSSYFEGSEFDQQGNFKQEDYSDLSKANKIELRDVFLSKEARYTACIHAFQKVSATLSDFLQMVGEITNSHFHHQRAKDLLFSGDFNSFAKEFNAAAWDRLLDESKFKTILTQKTREEFLKNNFESQKQTAFTRDNMIKLFEILFDNRKEILSDCILEVYNYMTRYHENCSTDEGWKTNSFYKVNKKIILPYLIERGWSGKFSIRYSSENNIDDIDRALCFITGNKFDNIVSIKQALKEQFDNLADPNHPSKSKECSSEFFKIKFYYKGTLHLQFKSTQIWQRFNQVVAELKGFPLYAAKEETPKEKPEKQPKTKVKVKTTDIVVSKDVVEKNESKFCDRFLSVMKKN